MPKRKSATGQAKQLPCTEHDGRKYAEVTWLLGRGSGFCSFRQNLLTKSSKYKTTSTTTVQTLLPYLAMKSVLGLFLAAAATLVAPWCVHGDSSPPLDLNSHVADQLQAWDGIGLTAWSVDSTANVCMLGVAGERIRGSGQLLQTTGDSRHHVGSVTKSMTASLMAILVFQGYFANGWDTTLPDVIPQAANGAYSNVTLRQIVSNTAGMDNFPSQDTVFPDFDEDDMTSYRWAVAVAAVESTPVFTPGTAFLYSNWAFVTAGHVIEKVTNVTWEEALATYLFEPLGIDLGPDPLDYVGAPNNDVDPWGHEYQTPCDPAAAACDNPLVLGPAGTFSGPVAAMATYFAWHLACHNGEHTTLLPQAACQEIHEPLDAQIKITGTGWSYGYGWICHDDDALGHVCTHNGSNTLNYYNVTLAFEQNRALVSYSNSASAPESQSRRMVNEMVGYLLSPEELGLENAEAFVCADPFSASVYIAEPTQAPTSTPTMLTTDAPTTAPTDDDSSDSTSSAASKALLLIAFAVTFFSL